MLGIVRTLLSHVGSIMRFVALESYFHARTVADRRGCDRVQVWLRSTTDEDGRLHFAVDSDSVASKGIGCLLAATLSGQTAEEIQEVLSRIPPASSGSWFYWLRVKVLGTKAWLSSSVVQLVGNLLT